jgi:putative DNA primase/helicase
MHGSDRPSDAVRDVTDYLHFVFPTAEDSNVAALEGDLNTLALTYPRLADEVRDREIVIAHHDTEQGRKDATAAARQVADRAHSIRLWAVPGFGSRCATMKEWCAANSLVNILELAHAAKWVDFVVFVSGQDQVSPDFTAIDPRRIAVDLIPVPSLEDVMIPERLRAWAVDISKRAWIPTDCTMAAAVVALSGLLGRRLAIRPKRRDRWLVVPNLWGGAVGLSGSMKTAAVEEGLRPLKRLAADAMDAHKVAMEGWHQRSLIASARRSAAKKELEQAARKKLGEARLEELAREASEGDGEAPPEPTRHLVNDVTIEKLGELMAANPNGLTLYRDELTGLLRTLEKQGHESDRGFLLESWNGTGSYTFDRIGRGTVHVPAACLAIFGGIQPGPLAKYLRGSLSGEEADGFVPRFQVLVYPDAFVSYTYVDKLPDAGARDRAYKAFEAIASLEPAGLGCEVDQDSGIPFLGFDDEAQALFVEWFTALEVRLRSGSLSPIMTAHLSKYRSLFPSLALVFHLVDSAGPDGKIVRLVPVSLEAAEVAAAWCDYLEAHAERVYQMAADGDPTDAIRLAGKIKDSLSNPFTIRDVQRKGWAGLTSNEDVRRTLGILEDRGWIKIVELPSSDPLGRGRPSEQCWINPKVASLPEGGGA